MHPILYQIGPVQIPTYGTIIVATFLLCLFGVKREAERAGLPPHRISDLAVFSLLAGLLGAKLLLILVDLPMYWRDPSLLVGVIRAAGVLYGGLVFGTVTAFGYLHKHKLPFWKTLDVMAPYLALGIGLGRLACFFAGCCHGFPYEGPLALHFPQHEHCDAPPGIGLFPVQLVAMANGIILFFVLWITLRRSKRAGTTALLFFTLYPLTRSAIEFLRGDEVRGLFLNAVSTSQIISIFVFVAAVVTFFVKRKSNDP